MTARPRPRAAAFVLLLIAWLGVACDGSSSSRGAGPGTDASSVPTARLRVRVEPVQRTAFETSARVTGTARAFRRAQLTAELAGRVEARAVEPGVEIEAGGPIVLLDDSRATLELRRAEASLSAAKTVLRHAERELARGDRLLRENTLSTQQHDDLRLAVDRARDELALAEVARDTARRQLEDSRITAPFAGLVDAIMVDAGDYVAPGTPVATLVDLSRVRLFGGVTASEAARLAPGATARAAFSDLGGDVFDATLQSVARVASAADGTYAIELWIDDPDPRLRDGMVARIELPDPDATPRLLARRAALLRRDGHPEVFVVEGRGDGAVARTRRVRTGRSEGEWVEILDGLAAGERVVWDGQFALADGAAIVIDGESAPNGPPPRPTPPGPPAAAVIGEGGASGASLGAEG